MKELKYHIYLDEAEYSRIMKCLISLKNDLIRQGRYTDAVDDILCKMMKARKKKIRIQYV